MKFKMLPMCLLALLLAGCATAPWPEGGGAGSTPEDRVANANRAMQSSPEDTTVRKDLRLTHAEAVATLLQEADAVRNAKRWGDARALYGRVLAIDPNNARALSGMAAIERDQKHAGHLQEARDQMIAKKPETAYSLVRKVLLENPQHPEALALQQELRSAQEPSRVPPHLKPPFDKPVTLELREANIKMVFEALSKATGINFILDKDIKPDTKATVYVKKARVEDAIEMVLATNGLQKKVLSETNALIFPNTQAKLKDYEDLMIRSFYFTNAKAKDVAALIKTVLKVKDIHVDERLNMLVMRDTPEVIRVAEKLVDGNDLPDPEVMLEIEVMEVSRSRLQELGIQYPNQLSVIGTNNAITLEALRQVDSSAISVSPLPSLRFKKETGDTNLLANPRIRVRNNEKAKVQVGDRVPIITTTSTANVGSSETVSYVDVGLKLEVEPRITLDDHVNIKVGLEVSSLGESTTLENGSKVYQIGTRNAGTVLRLRDGETQVLAGLISEDERKSANKVPGVGDIPLLGRLFSNNSDERVKTEIVLAITPRVLGNISRPDAEIAEYWSGTESVISDQYRINQLGASSGSSQGLRRQVPAPAVENPAETAQPVTPLPESPPVPAVQPPTADSGVEQPGQPKPVISPASVPASL
jgi:general secretion pathway protein D